MLRKAQGAEIKQEGTRDKEELLEKESNAGLVINPKQLKMVGYLVSITTKKQNFGQRLSETIRYKIR